MFSWAESTFELFIFKNKLCLSSLYKKNTFSSIHSFFLRFIKILSYVLSFSDLPPSEHSIRSSVLTGVHLSLVALRLNNPTSCLFFLLTHIHLCSSHSFAFSASAFFIIDPSIVFWGSKFIYFFYFWDHDTHNT